MDKYRDIQCVLKNNEKKAHINNYTNKYKNKYQKNVTDDINKHHKNLTNEQ